MKKYFLNFIEEGNFNTDRPNHIAGRVEIWENDIEIDELRYFTDNEDIFLFREEWDWKTVSQKELNRFKRLLKDIH